LFDVFIGIAEKIDKNQQEYDRGIYRYINPKLLWPQRAVSVTLY
jgi:hypothetical protein